MNLAGLRSHFANWREWELNPVVVKELRQAVRSWAVTGMLLLFLGVLFIASLIILVFQTLDTDQDTQLGSTMFTVFLVILAFASMLFIPFYSGIRVATERQENNPDLLYISTLSPARIIRGKFLCSAYVTVLFFSACLPFMTFTNLMRGVDLPTVFFILFFLFLAVCVANMIAIFFACIPVSRPFKILFALLGFSAVFPTVISMVVYAVEFMGNGVGAAMGERNFLIGSFTAIAIALVDIGLFFVLSVALVSPPSANRALPVRAYITVVWLLCGLLTLGWVAETKNALAMIAWTSQTYELMAFALLVVISNSDQLSRRVRRAIPQSWLKRALAFLFFNGAAGGLVWVALMVIITFLIGDEISRLFPKYTTGGNQAAFGAVVAYVFAYALSALFIHRKFLSKRPPKLAGLLAVSIAAFWALMPSILLFFLDQLTWKSVEGLQLGNVFNVFSMRDDSRLYYHVYFAFGWLALMVVLNAKWFFAQAKNFRPLPKDEPPVIV